MCVWCVCVCVRCVRGLCCVLSGFFRVFVLLATLFCVLCVSGVVWCECVFCFVSVSVRACVNVHCVGSVLLLHCVSIARCLGSHRSMHAVCFCFRRRAAFVFPLGRLCCACHFSLVETPKNRTAICTPGITHWWNKTKKTPRVQHRHRLGFLKFSPPVQIGVFVRRFVACVRSFWSLSARIDEPGGSLFPARLTRS